MSQEVEERIGLVLYGGISLAIYMGGVVEEIYNLVLASATNGENDGSLAPSVGVWRKWLVGPAQKSKRRFVVDIISGTSAGGMNGAFLSKALVGKKPISGLRQFWIEEGDISKLLNDQQSVKGLTGVPFVEPRALLNGRRVYVKLLEAFHQMEQSPEIRTDGALVKRLDLYMTATNLRGRGVPLYVGSLIKGDREPSVSPKLGTEAARELTPSGWELEHRAVFQFTHDEDRQIKDFKKENLPFLAFVSRCTSSIVPAFEPMRLCDIKDLVNRWYPFYRYDTNTWLRLFRSYWRDAVPRRPDLVPREATKAAIADFEFIAFGDGGYLDNKPFRYVTQALSHRRADTKVSRQVFYVEPDPVDQGRPQGLTETSPDPPTVIDHAQGALSLSSNQSIQWQIAEMQKQSELARRVGRSRGTPQDDDKDDDKDDEKNDDEKNQEELPKNTKVYQDYLELRFESIVDYLTEMLGNILGIFGEQAFAAPLRLVIRQALLAATQYDKPGDPEALKVQDLEDVLRRLDVPFYQRWLEEARRRYEVNDGSTKIKGLNDVLYPRLFSRPELTGAQSLLDEARQGLADLKVPGKHNLCEQKMLVLMLFLRISLEELAYVRAGDRSDDTRFDPVGHARHNPRKTEDQRAAWVVGRETKGVHKSMSPQPAETEKDADDDQQRDKEEKDKDEKAKAKAEEAEAKDNEHKKALESFIEADDKNFAAAFVELLRIDASVEPENNPPKDSPPKKDPTEKYPTEGEIVRRRRPVILATLFQLLKDHLNLAESKSSSATASSIRPCHSDEPTSRKLLDDHLQEAEFAGNDAREFSVLYALGLSDSYSLKISRISPVDATFLTETGDDQVPVNARQMRASKLGGTRLGHFGAFFSKNWRFMDILWGRLDAAEMLVRTYESDTQKQKELLGNLQRAIVIEALTSVDQYFSRSERSEVKEDLNQLLDVIKERTSEVKS